MVTRRCTQRQFLLRPDPETNNNFIYCLAEAAARFEIVVLLPSVLSNHHHTVVYDRHGRIVEFVEHLHKMLAKCQNALRGRWENMFSNSAAFSKSTPARFSLTHEAIEPSTSGRVRVPRIPPLSANQPRRGSQSQQINPGAVLSSTNWFRCGSPSDLERLVSEVHPGSSLSFCFDRHFAEHRGESALVPARELLAATEDALVGILAPDGFHIEMTLPDEADVRELFAEISPDARVFVGVYPGGDNDGFDAVTLVVPDLDGVVRPHPY